VCTPTEEERLGLVQGDSASNLDHRSLPAYEEEDDVDYEASPSDDYAYDDDVKSYTGDSHRYGRGITEASLRGRAGSGSSSGDETGLGISSREAPPKPPAHGSSYGSPRSGGGSGSAGGAGAAGTPAAFL